jgi:hypothetical protein
VTLLMRVPNFRQDHQAPPPWGADQWAPIFTAVVAMLLLVGGAALIHYHLELAKPALTAVTVLGLSGEVAREIQGRRPVVRVRSIMVCGVLLACGSAVIVKQYPGAEIDFAVLLAAVAVLLPLGGFLSRRR